MPILNETWEDIKGYEKHYQISNFGRVKSMQRYINIKNDFKRLIKERILKNNLNTYGYYYVELVKNKKGKKHLISRLVALEFLPNHNNLPQVNHKDGNKSNNKISNLEWCTQNQRHAWEIGLHKGHVGELNPCSKLTKIEVITIKKELKNYYHGLCEILSKKFNVHSATIRSIKQNRRWMHIKI